MKILTILTYYSPHWTGLTNHAIRAAEELARRGHEVTVLTIRFRPDLPARETINGVRVIRLQPIGRFSRGMIAPGFPQAASRLISANDVVHIHTPLPEALLVALLCKAADRAFVMTHHGDIVMPRHSLLNRFVEEAAFRILHATGRLAHTVTSYNEDYTRHSRLLRGLGDNVLPVHPPVDIPLPCPQAAAAWRRRLGLEDRLLIGFAGRWVEEKGFDILLRAMPRISQAFPNAHLIFAGECHVVYEDFFRRCQSLIDALQGRITFLGLLEQPARMAEFYAMCHLFALPSRTEMLALTQIEAMLCGCPVVATDIPGGRVVVNTTGYGRLAAPRDPDSLATEIIEVLRNRDRYLPSRDRVRALFNTGSTIDAYESLLFDAARTSRVPPVHRRRLQQERSSAEGRGIVALSCPHEANLTASGLSAKDLESMDTLLSNEFDMAFRRRARILLSYLDLRDGERVLDCGCGMGFYLRICGTLRNLVTIGIDSEHRRLNQASAGVPAAGLVRGDLHTLPLPDRSMDKVLMSEVLEHLENDQRGLDEAFRVLRPGGVLAISVPHERYPTLWDPINRLWTAFGGKPFTGETLAGIWSNHRRLYLPRSLARKVALAGFRVERLEEATHHCAPLSHFLLYGIGKPLLENGLLPGFLARHADRMTAGSAPEGSFNPLKAIGQLLRFIDRRNEHPGIEKKSSFVNILVKAKKPD